MLFRIDPQYSYPDFVFVGDGANFNAGGGSSPCGDGDAGMIQRMIDNKTDDGQEEYLCYDDWMSQLRISQPQADYWYQSLELDLLILRVNLPCYFVDCNMSQCCLQSVILNIYLNHILTFSSSV